MKNLSRKKNTSCGIKMNWTVNRPSSRSWMSKIMDSYWLLWRSWGIKEDVLILLIKWSEEEESWKKSQIKLSISGWNIFWNMLEESSYLSWVNLKVLKVLSLISPKLGKDKVYWMSSEKWYRRRKKKGSRFWI